MACVIEYDQIPRVQVNILSRTLLAAMERFYAIPENVERFEAWKDSEEGRAYTARCAARANDKL